MNRGRSPGTTRARSGSVLALLCAASAVAWGLPAFPASAQVPPDTAPSFGTTTVVDQAYTATVDIGSLELPAATGGNGALTYALALACASGDEGTAQDCGLPSGLTFDADDRELAGTPDTPGTYRMEYKVTDADDNTAAGDADTLNFTITVATAVPGPPGNLAAEARPGTVKLTWDLPAHTGASKIIRHEYRYEVFRVDPSPWITMASSAPGGTNATSFNVGELTPARIYSFWVRAVNGAGGGPESGKVTVLTKSPEPPSGKNLNISKEFTDDPVVAGRTATLQFSVTNTHLTEDATDVKYTDNVHDMLPGATLDTSQATRAVRCTRYDGTDVSGDCGSTSSENYRECGTRIWAGTTPVQIQWWDGFTVPAGSTCYASDVVKIPADTATGSYQSTSGAVTGKYGETSVTGNTARDILRVRANDQPVQVEKWFSGTRNTGTVNDDDTYNYGKLEFNYRITNPNPTVSVHVSFTEDFSAFVEKFKSFSASSAKYTLYNYGATGCPAPRVNFGEGNKYGTFSFSTGSAFFSGVIPRDNGSCTYKVTLQIPRGVDSSDGPVNAKGTYTATTRSIKTTRSGGSVPVATGADVSASVTIVPGRASKPLRFTKAFGPPAVVGAGGTVDLTYTLTNPDGQRDATNITFGHDLTEFISGAVATSVPVPPCGDDSAITLENRNKRLRFRAGLLGTGKTCTFTVTIRIPADTDPGTYTSTTRRDSYNMGNDFVGEEQAFVLPAISADVLVAAVPAAPTDFTPVPGDQQVTLGWTAPADTGGTGVELTGYEYSQDGGDNWTDTGATSTSHVVEALTNGTEHEFRVRARNLSGAGAPTATQRAAPRPVLTISDADVEEGNADATNMTFTVTQSATSTKPVKVEYKTADPSDASLERATAGEDYDAVSDGTLTFSANTTGDALTKTVTVRVSGDTLKENDEHFAVVLHTPDNAHIQDSEGVGKITNDDDNTAPSFGTETVDDQTAVAYIALADLELPLATGGNGTLTYALACASGQTGCEGTPALPPGLSFDASTRTLSGTPKVIRTTTLTYTVTDADDSTDADDTDSLTFDITVDANQAPTAHVGDDRTVAEGDTVTLDGSGSADPEEQTLTYTWTAPSDVSLSSTTTAKPTFDAPEVDGEDNYTFALIVSDGVQDSAAASVTITVEDDTAPSFGTEVDDQAEVEHIAMEALELPAATAGNGTLTYALACASGQTGCEGTPALPPGLSFDASTRTLSGTPTATGTTTLTYTVADADDNTADTDTGTLSFDITVGANQAPTADAGAAQTAAEGDLVTLDGSGSTDPEGQTLTYAWTVPSGSGITLSSPTAAKPTFDAPEVDSEDDYTFTLVVNDGVQDSVAASVTVTVTDDTAPSFGTETVDDQTEVAHIAIEELVLPLATGGNGDLSYVLACATGATGCTGTPALPPGLSFAADDRELTGTPDTPGTYSMEYTATDADDNVTASDAATLTFDITVGANQVPTAHAGDAQTVAEGDTVTLDGSGSTDPEEQPLTYEWTALDGITLSDAMAAQPTFDAPEVDGENDYTFTLTVNDGVQDSVAASVTITVEDDVAPSLETEVDDRIAVSHIAMEALVLPEATGGNGDLSYALACASEATGCTGTPALPPGLSFDVLTRTLSGTPTATGATTLTYTVTDADDNNADTDADSLDFEITVNANQAPTADAGAAQTVAEGDNVTLDGSGSSDPEEQPLTYTWTAQDGITLSSPTAAKPTFDAPEVDGEDDYTFTLIVNDGVQDSAPASVTITVEDDVAPSFGTDVAAQTEVAHIAMEDLVLPAATGGNGTLTYALTCAAGATGCEGTPALPPGLSFDALTRTLSGTPTTTGTTTLTYTVTDADDNDGDTDTGTLSFDIAVNANQAPTADAGAAQTVAEGDTVTLDGSGSTDPEGQTLTYAWTVPSGSGITLSSPTAAKPTLDAPEVDGTNDYTFTLIVNDGVQDSAAANVTITVEDDVAPSFGTDVDDQTEVAHIAMEALELPAATGGNGTLTYALACASGQTGCEGTPALPPGFSFDASTRILSGTPTATGTTTLTYTVTDADDNTADTDAGTLSFEITVTANQVPTADAGAARTVAERDRVTLDGSGSSDPEEQTLTYTWTALDGITLSSPTVAKPTFDAPEVDGAADYTFTLIVNDGVQDSAAASVTITVEDDSAPSFGTETVDDQTEVAHIAMEALVLPAATGGNSDLSYALACASGATGCTGTPALPPGLSFDASTRTLSGTPTATGTTTLTYTVTDADDNVTASDAATLTFDITVSANQVPTADAGAAQTVAEGDTVTLDGSGSSDPEEQTLTYTWTAPSGSGITLSSPSAAEPTFTAPEVDGAADYTFTLIVNDGAQDSVAASVTVTVEDDTAPSFGAEVDDQTEVVHIAMEALELPLATGGNGTLTYALACASGQTGCEGTPALPPGLSFDASTRTLSGTPKDTGTTTLSYTVTDADDNNADTDTGTLSFDIAVGANQAPTADAGADRTVAEGDTVTLDGSGSTDPEGQTLTYGWTVPSGSGITLSSPTEAEPTFAAPDVDGAADYTFTLTVNDGVQDSTAASVTITVKDDAAPSFGTETVDDQTEVVHIAMENLDLPAAMGGNGDLSYALACAAGATGCTGTPALPPGLSFDASTRTLSGTPTATGTTSLTYTVTDADDNVTASDEATLTFAIAVGANQMPTADAGTAQTVAESDTVMLDGSGSSDPEGQTLTYAWTVPSGSGITLSDASAEQPTFDAPAVGSDGAEYEFTLTVNDGVQASAAASVTITVEDDTAPSFGTVVDDQTAVAHIAVEVLLPAATGGNGDLSYALACAAGATGCTGTPALPPGLSFDAATRTLSGTPTATGTTTLTYTVTDADDNVTVSDASTLTFEITVGANQVPTADAGAAQTVTEGDLVTLDGSGSTDPERQTLTYAWTVPVGSGITLSSTTAAKPTFTAPTLSADTPYTFTLTVNDGAQDSAAASVTITVEDDTAPSFGTETVDDQTEVVHIAMADLELPVATGGNGTLTYALACAAGATGCTGTPALPPGLSFDVSTRTLSGTPTATGTTSLTYTVTDADDNVTASDAVTLSFNITVGANQVPTANAGAAQTVTEGDLVTLDGSGSTDPEGQTLTYAWTVPVGSGITLSSASATTPTFDAPAVGLDGAEYEFTLTVNDGVQDSAAASVTITVEDDTAPSFGADVDDQTEVVHIAMEALVLPVATGGNGTLTYTLACAPGATGCTGTPALPSGLSFDAPTRTLSGTPMATGTTSLTYTVTDADDNVTTSDAATLTFDITVNVNQAPTADAGAAQTVTEGDTVTLDGSGSADPEGQTLTYAWTVPSGSGITLSSPTAAKPTFDAPQVSSDGGEYEFTLTVNDGVQDSAAANVTITVMDDTAPSFGTVVDDQTEVVHIAMENLELPVATGGNGDLSYALACAAGATGCTGTPALPPGLSFDASTRTLSGTPTATGTTTLTYTVTDADDNTAATDAGSLTFNITVGANQAPTADAGPAQTVTEGDRVTLDGSGSTDPEGQTLTYAWTAPSGSGITLSSTTAAEPTFTAPDVANETNYTFTLIVNDGVQNSAAASVTITVKDDTAPSFGVEVDDQTEVVHIAMARLDLPAATGGNGTLTYMLACASGATGCTGTPALPPGLSFDASTRTLSGTPTATGTTTLTYTVTDADDNTADTDTGTLSFDITVHANQAPTAHAGAAQTVAEGDRVILDGSGSSDPENQELTYTWTTLSGITLSSTSAAKPTFTAPDVTGETDYTFTLTVNDGVQDSAAASVTITVKDDTAPSFGTVVDGQTEVADIAMEALVLPAATGGNGTLTYALACAAGATGCTGTPALPPGLSFDASTRTLSGTPTATGTTTLAYTATDADDNVTASDAATLAFDIIVGANQAPTAHAGDAQTVTEEDTVTLDGSGSTDPEEQTLTYTWTPPSGITLSSTSVAKPTFTAPAVNADTPYTFTLTVNDGVQDSAAVSVTVTVEDDTAPSFALEPVADQLYVKDKAISTLTLPQLTLGNGTNEDHDYEWAPALPTGLELDSSNPASLTVSGTPTAASSETTYTLTVSDRDDDTATVSVKITVEDNEVPSFADVPVADQLYVTGKAISTLTLPELTLGNGANDDHDYSWDPALPAGLELVDADPASLTVSGTPTAASSQTSYTLTVTDVDGDPASVSVKITVEGAASPSFASTEVEDQLYLKDEPITALVLPVLNLGNGANEDHNYEWAPALPAGLVLADADPASLSVSGTPTEVSIKATYTLTVTDVDGDDTSLPVKITVEEAASPQFASTDVADQLYTKDVPITTLVLPSLTLGNGANEDHDYEWDPALPAGLAFAHGDPASLSVSGTPTVPSSEPYTLTVTDVDGDTAVLAFRITVTDGPPTRRSSGTTPALLASTSSVEVRENSTAEFNLRLATEPTYDVTVTWQRLSGGDEDLHIQQGASLTFTDTTWNTAQTVTLEARNDADTVDGTATFQATSASADPNYNLTVEVTATEIDDDGPRPAPVPVALPLAFAGSVNDLVYTEGKEIPELVLPQANGGTAPLAYGLAPLPSGLVFDDNPASRRLAGTPDRPGSTPLSYTVTDAGGATATLAFRIVVEEDVAPLFDPGMVANLKPQNYIAGNAVHLRLPVLTLGNGANGDHSYEWSGKDGQSLALPVGLSLEGGPASLAVTGTPTEHMVSTEYTLTVTDRDGDATRLTLHIAVLEITEKPPGSEVTFDEETGEIMLRNVRFALADGPERTWDAARIKLPAGHMVNGLALRVANLADDEEMPPDPGTLFGGVALVISPTGGLAGGTASVCLSTDGLPQGKAPRLYHEEAASGVWKRVDTEMRGDAGLICGDVSSFSRFRAGYEAESLVQVRERALEHMLAAFGRTVATDAVSVLSGRMVDVSQGGTGSRFTLAGRTPGSRGTVPGHDGMTIRTGGDRATAARNDGDWLGTGRGEPDLWADRVGSVTAISDRELLTGTSFQLALGAEDGGAGGHATLWGKGRTAGFRGISAEGFALDGDVVSGWLGIDWRRSDLLLGLALSHSQGEMDYEDLDAINRDFSAQVEADLTGVYPYARLSLDDDLDVWGIAGVGAGGLTLADGFGGNETDIDMGMAAAGARRALGSWSLRDIDFAVKGDALSVMMRSDPRGLASPDSGDDLPEVNVSAQRVRLALEGGHTRTLESGGLVQSTLELGARYDRGGAETGAGVDLAGAVRYEDLSRGLTVEGRGRLLLAHEAEGFEEWGVGGTIRLSPGASGLGYSFSMEPSWGAAASGAGRLWNDRVTTGADTAARRRRLAAEFGYGLGVFGGQGVLTPHVAASLTDGDGQDYRVGARLRLGLDLRVDVGVHHLEGSDGEAELGIGLQISSGF